MRKYWIQCDKERSGGGSIFPPFHDGTRADFSLVSIHCLFHFLGLVWNCEDLLGLLWADPLTPGMGEKRWELDSMSPQKGILSTSRRMKSSFDDFLKNASEHRVWLEICRRTTGWGTSVWLGARPPRGLWGNWLSGLLEAEKEDFYQMIYGDFMEESWDIQYQRDQSDTEDEVDSDIDEGDEPFSDEVEESRRKHKVVSNT